MKKLNVLFALLLCFFINEISAQNIRYSVLGYTSLKILVNGQAVTFPTTVINPDTGGITNGDIDISSQLIGFPGNSVIEVYAESYLGNHPLDGFVGEDGLPTYPFADEFTYYNEEHTVGYYMFTMEAGCNDMYVEIKA